MFNPGKDLTTDLYTRDYFTSAGVGRTLILLKIGDRLSFEYLLGLEKARETLLYFSEILSGLNCICGRLDVNSLGALVNERIEDIQPFLSDLEELCLAFNSCSEADIKVCVLEVEGDISTTLLKAEYVLSYEMSGQTFCVGKAHKRLEVQAALISSPQKCLEGFYLVAQPIVDIDSEAIIGYEFLSRWQRGEEVIQPSVFMPIFDKLKYGHLLTSFVIDALYEFLSDRPDIKDKRIHLNVNGSDLKISSFYREVSALAKVCPNLYLEIVETSSSYIPTCAKEMENLRRLGVHFCIDDFGDGENSILFVLNPYIDTIKFSRSLLNAPGPFFIKLIELVREMGKEVIVEGIEDSAMVKSLHSLGVLGQGFYYSRPLSLSLL